MPEFISNKLTHWVGQSKEDDESFDILNKILSTFTLRLSKCPTGDEDTINSKRSFYEYIVCFTDIPFLFSEEHCRQFGKFGIAFNKQKFIEYGANPVLYCTKSLEDSYHEASKLIEKMLSEFWPMDEYKKYSNQYRNLRRLFSFLQTYEYKSGEEPNYYQREWRISLQHDRVPEKVKDLKPGDHAYDTNEDCCWMLFNKKDVEKIIVPQRYYEKSVTIFCGFGKGNILCYENIIKNN